jgi:hypothetical protein
MSRLQQHLVFLVSGHHAVIFCLAGKQRLFVVIFAGVATPPEAIYSSSLPSSTPRLPLLHLADAGCDVSKTLAYHFHDSFHIIGT